MWKWAETEAFLADACDAIPESFTARRSLIFNAPGLPRSTTHTMNTGIQLIKPGELAWAHRHTISALRFVIEGHPDLHTVVDGAPCPMADNDLVLTPNWHWHDHHNGARGRALWFDVLDGGSSPRSTRPCSRISARTASRRATCRGRASLSMGGDERAPCRRARRRGLRLKTGAPCPISTRPTGGAVLRTIGAAATSLPPGFKGAPHRHSSSAVYLVIRGAGHSEVGAGRSNGVRATSS